MPLSLQSLDFYIICGFNDLETYDVKREGQNSITAFVASEAGKQINFMITNKLVDFDLLVTLHIDGEYTRWMIRAGWQFPVRIPGILTSANSALPFKFQELELVDPDVEDAPVVPEIGTIEVRAYRCQSGRLVEYQHRNHRLNEGRVSERSKKAGWHHVSTADEVPNTTITSVVEYNRIDPSSAPYASVKVFYRPRELLMADGVIVGRGVGAEISGVSEVNDRKRAREVGSPGPSKRRTRSTTKHEETPADARSQQIQDPQAERNLIMAGESSSSVKREPRSSPIDVDLYQGAGEIVDLTGED